MKQQKEFSRTIILTIGVLVILGLIGYMIFKSGGLSPTPSKPQNSINLKGDINRDGKVDSEDADLIKKASPCNHVDPCWKKVVGKTKDGDNPIYASDLDLNHDDNVNELDISAMNRD